MIMGERYDPYAVDLISDCEQCAMALHLFNQFGLPPKHRLQIFKRVLCLRPCGTTDHEVGSDCQRYHDAAKDMVVETLFYCDYGYNITVGSNSVIGAECRVSDSGKVAIGKNVVISPCVTLLCQSYAINPL